MLLYARNESTFVSQYITHLLCMHKRAAFFYVDVRRREWANIAPLLECIEETICETRVFATERNANTLNDFNNSFYCLLIVYV